MIRAVSDASRVPFIARVPPEEAPDSLLYALPVLAALTVVYGSFVLLDLALLNMHLQRLYRNLGIFETDRNPQKC